MTTGTEFEVHQTTGLPIEPHSTFEVGDLVTESINSDGYPGVVVHVTPKTVYVAGVRYQVANVQPNDVPGWNGYGDSATLVVDPESVKEAIAAGKDGGVTKYVLRITKPVGVNGYGMSLNEQEKYGGPFHRSAWRRPGGYGHLSHGARYRQDPHV